MRTRLLRQGVAGGLLGLSLLLQSGMGMAEQSASAQELLATRCAACHQAEGGTQLGGRGDNLYAQLLMFVSF